MNLQEQFDVTDDEIKKEFRFNAKTNLTTSYSVDYFECDFNETNAWITLYKAVKKDYPNIILTTNKA